MIIVATIWTKLFSNIEPFIPTYLPTTCIAIVPIFPFTDVFGHTIRYRLVLFQLYIILMCLEFVACSLFTIVVPIQKEQPFTCHTAGPSHYDAKVVVCYYAYGKGQGRFHFVAILLLFCWCFSREWMGECVKE